MRNKFKDNFCTLNILPQIIWIQNNRDNANESLILYFYRIWKHPVILFCGQRALRLYHLHGTIIIGHHSIGDIPFAAHLQHDCLETIKYKYSFSHIVTFTFIFGCFCRCSASYVSLDFLIIENTGFMSLIRAAQCICEIWIKDVNIIKIV